MHWREVLLALFPDWHWQVLELPARHFNWRMRGNPLHWALEERAVLDVDYDAVLATSMVDLATLRGLVPRLARARTLLYFHENQFAYPVSEGQANAVELQMVSLYAALAADTLLFNSRFNQHTFLNGCSALLRRLPDYVPHGVVEALAAKASVVPVPLREPAKPPVQGEQPWPGTHRGEQSPLRLVWLGRFEYDKGPEGLLHFLRAMEKTQVDYEIAVVGQRFRSLPAAFDTIASEFGHRLVHMGFVECEAAFQGLLSASDIALSTALHEFQGLALIQAAACGAVPVVPARQAYPEVFPADFCYGSAPGQPLVEAQHAVEKVLAVRAGIAASKRRVPDMSGYFGEHLKPLYERVLRGEQIEGPAV